jgi:lysophospholipase L1-like esterase
MGLADERNAMKEEYRRDGVHPNAAGYAVLAPLVEAGITRASRRNRSGTVPLHL